MNNAMVKMSRMSYSKDMHFDVEACAIAKLGPQPSLVLEQSLRRISTG